MLKPELTTINREDKKRLCVSILISVCGDSLAISESILVSLHQIRDSQSWSSAPTVLHVSDVCHFAQRWLKLMGD